MSVATLSVAHAQAATAVAMRVRPSLCGVADTARAPAPRLTWHDEAVPWAEWSVVLGENRVPVSLIVVRIDPALIALTLDIARRENALGPWTIAGAPPDAVVAFNAGQFTDAGPWGWVVHRGREWQGPGVGPLSAAIVVDSSGRIGIVPADSIASIRSRGGWMEALQSYPMILDGYRAPTLLCAPGAINQEHRDIRFALGTLPNGHVLLVLSRYAGAGRVTRMTERLPIGPTTLEMSRILRHLGAVRAVMLDGGLSAQLRVRSGADDRQWPGLRSVPLAIVGRRR